MIGKTLEDTVRRFPFKVAMVCDDQFITYKELYENIRKIQQQLISIIGQPFQKKVAFLLENDIDFLTLFMAISEMGAIAIPLDPKWSNKDLQHILADCTPHLFITHGSTTTSHSTTISMKQLKSEPLTAKPNASNGDTELFYIGYTSGTTGKPKGYLRSHSSWMHSFTSSESVFNLTKEDVIFSPGPLVHSHFLYAAVHALQMGATVYITKKFQAQTVYHLLRTCPITVLYLVPTMFSALHSVYAETEKSILQLKKVISAGAKWQVPLKSKANEIFPHAEIFEFYGASELSFVSVLDNKGQQENPDSVGRPFPGVTVSIRRHDGTEAAYGEIGKLFIKSKQTFSGYLNNDEATKEVFHGEWATVGDLAYIDFNGYITLVGREKNKIISGGLNIYPEEIEKVLSTLSEVHEVIVLGIDDPYWGEKVVAVIQWKDEKQLSHSKLKQYCKEHLATYKCPQLFIEVDSFPYTTSRKIARHEVFRRVQQQIQLTKEVKR